MNIENMEDLEFQELAAAVLTRLSNEPYTINKGVFELMNESDVLEMQTNVCQYTSFDI